MRFSYKILSLIISIIAICFIFGCFGCSERNNNFENQGLVQETVKTDKDYEPGVVLIKLKKDVKLEKSNVIQSLRNLGLERVDKDVKLGIKKTFDFDKFRITKKDKNVKKMIKKLKETELIEYCEPNYKIGLLGMNTISNNLPNNLPNDPLYDDSWGLENIHISEAWKISKGSKNITVAISDTGINYEHEDLKENIWINSKEIPNNKIDDDNNGYIDDVNGWNFVDDTNNPIDTVGHGTHCAGIIGACGNNGIGIVGTNWVINLMPIKIIGDKEVDAYCDDAAKSIYYAVDNGAKVINCSWWTLGYYSKFLENAVEYANKNGVMIVAAAGNQSRNNDISHIKVWPASWEYENVISVAAIMKNNKFAYFSNWGEKSVNLAAPGDNILSTYFDTYTYMSGTSMATPYVTGVIGLALSEVNTLDVYNIRKILLDNVEKVKGLKHRVVTGGKLNAEKVLKEASIIDRNSKNNKNKK